MIIIISLSKFAANLVNIEYSEGFFGKNIFVSLMVLHRILH